MLLGHYTSTIYKRKQKNVITAMYVAACGVTKQRCVSDVRAVQKKRPTFKRD